jgi:hypothetical protein
MLNQGKSQKEIASCFKVSPVAVCKRLKRLNSPSPENILDKYNLTDRQKSFVVEKAKGKTNTQAALESYEVSTRGSAKVIGSQLMAEPIIKMALNELMGFYLPQYYRIKKLRSHVDHPDPNISLKGLDLSWRLDGSYAAEKVEVKEFSYAENRHSLTHILISKKKLIQGGIDRYGERELNGKNPRELLEAVEAKIEKTC